MIRKIGYVKIVFKASRHNHNTTWTNFQLCNRKMLRFKNSTLFFRNVIDISYLFLSCFVLHHCRRKLLAFVLPQNGALGFLPKWFCCQYYIVFLFSVLYSQKIDQIFLLTPPPPHPPPVIPRILTPPFPTQKRTRLWLAEIRSRVSWNIAPLIISHIRYGVRKSVGELTETIQLTFL